MFCFSLHQPTGRWLVSTWGPLCQRWCARSCTGLRERVFSSPGHTPASGGAVSYGKSGSDC